MSKTFLVDFSDRILSNYRHNVCFKGFETKFRKDWCFLCKKNQPSRQRWKHECVRQASPIVLRSDQQGGRKGYYIFSGSHIEEETLWRFGMFLVRGSCDVVVSMSVSCKLTMYNQHQTIWSIDICRILRWIGTFTSSSDFPGCLSMSQHTNNTVVSPSCRQPLGWRHRQVQRNGSFLPQDSRQCQRGVRAATNTHREFSGERPGQHAVHGAACNWSRQGGPYMWVIRICFAISLGEWRVCGDVFVALRRVGLCVVKCLTQ